MISSFIISSALQAVRVPVSRFCRDSDNNPDRKPCRNRPPSAQALPAPTLLQGFFGAWGQRRYYAKREHDTAPVSPQSKLTMFRWRCFAYSHGLFGQPAGSVARLQIHALPA
ncbi:hypothetical protein DSY4642 [Desulfitobacterium hafniense Y51]|uniref:Uncharacterized protein n=1 Tax=Desulfitobacterium hafniense (strain Y51) TaxID=138119 RepID=Q24NG1_DESHY|nr:hypothetical protein DSY4642 [Desulfitobacterium hafniense Y51]